MAKRLNKYWFQYRINYFTRVGHTWYFIINVLIKFDSLMKKKKHNPLYYSICTHALWILFLYKIITRRC